MTPGCIRERISTLLGIKSMASSSLNALRHGRTSRCTALMALALATIHVCLLAGATNMKGAALGAESGSDATRSTRPPNPARPVPLKQAPPLSPNAKLQQIVKSKIALVVDANTSEKLLAKDADRVVPIASITKLMTAMVVLDANLPLAESLKISVDDRDLLMGTGSRLRVGLELSRQDMLHLALMASENRAAAALSRYYPGGRPSFIKAMNAKAKALGMMHTHFVNPNGLTNQNVSTASDLVKLVRAAGEYRLIREFTTDPHYDVRIGNSALPFMNSNRLVGRPDWDIVVQKTGFTNQAGRCVVMRVNADGRSLIMIFLDAYGKLTRFADARRVVMQLALSQGK